MNNSISQITPTASAYSAMSLGSTSTTGTSKDMNQFLLMMMAQLKNQNPLNPMQDDQMLGQLAQLNSLNELTDLNSKMDELISASQIGYASSLVGKTVVAQVSNQDPIKGEVTSVSNANGQWSATIGDQTVPLTAIVSVQEKETV